MKMGPSRLIWMVILPCIFYSVTFVESKKLKIQEDIGVILKSSSEQDEHRKMKYFNENSFSETESRYNSQKKEKSKGKKKNIFQGSSSSESEEVIKDRKYFKKKNRTNYNKKIENIDSKTSEELVQKGKKIKAVKKTNKNSNNFSEFTSNRFRKRDIMDEALESSGNKETRLKTPKGKRTKQHPQEVDNFKGLHKTRREQNNYDASNHKIITMHESDETLVDDKRSNSGYCSNDSTYENRCSESAANPGHSLDEETQEEFVELKKVRYSKKFAHEKLSKKEKNKEDENILKLHRKAETDPKNTKSSKRINRSKNQDEDSSEEIIPRRRLNLYEDDEG